MDAWEFCYIRKIFSAINRKAERIELVYLKHKGARRSYPITALQQVMTSLEMRGWVPVPAPPEAKAVARAGMLNRRVELQFYRRPMGAEDEPEELTG